MKHLSEEQMQAFLDNSADEQQRYAAHLETCPECRTALASYRTLYGALAQEPSEGLAPAFASRVLQRLPEESPATSQTIEWVLFAISAVAGLAVTIYLVVANFTQQQLAAISDAVKNVFAFAGDSQMLSAEKLHIFIFALVVLVVISLMDKYLLHRKM